VYPAAGLKDQSGRPGVARGGGRAEGGGRGRERAGGGEWSGDAEQLAYNKPHGCVRSVLFRSFMLRQ